MRTIIDLPDDQIQKLAAVCKREGLSRAEVVRRAVTAYLEARRAEDAGDAFGMWASRDDGLRYEDRIRAEWD